MKRYSQYTLEVGDRSDIPFWKKAGPVDLLYVGYGLLVVVLVIVSYILGATHILPYDPQEINLELLMAPPNTEGHLLGTDFMGRDMLSRIIIGIQAYFPLADSTNVGSEELTRAWRERMTELRAFAEEHNRRIVFTELGYNRSFAAPIRPWESRVDGREAETMQEACLRIALAAVEEEPTVAGAFLWKWFPNPRPVGRTFQLATPRLKQAIAEVWLP